MHGKHKLLTLFELAFTVLSLCHLSQGLIPLWLSGGASEGDGISLNGVDFSLNAKVSLLIYGISFILLFLRWRKVVAVLLKDRLLVLLLAIVCLSYFWSVLPSETIRFCVYAVGTTGFGLYIATRYTLKEQIIIYSWTFGLIFLLSILFVVALPHYGIMGGLHAGAWRGIYTHKNQFGLVIVPAAVIFLLRAVEGKEGSWIFWLLLIGAIAATVLAKSTTSLGNLLIMLFLCIIYRIFRWRYELMVSAILAGVLLSVVGILLFINYVESDLLFVAIGKDSTFSGRTDIWRFVWDMIQLRPWLGYGLAAFWHGGLQGPSAYVQLAVRTAVVYAHNGFLDLWLAIGLIGLTAFLVGLLSATLKALALLRKTNTPEGFWPLLFLTYIFLSNITEGSVTTMDDMFWAMYSATVFSLLIVTGGKNTLFAYKI